MSKINNENYVVIQGFMLNDLQLKGNELLIYAIIHGFSQTDGQFFKGSLQYLCEWTNSTKQGVLKSLKSLLDKNLIAKQEQIIGGVKLVYYRSTKFTTGKQSLMGGIKQSLPNNININNINKERNVLKKESFTPPTFEEVKEYAEKKGFPNLAQTFFEYFTVGNWIDKKGEPVTNWKRKFITWVSFEKKEQAPKVYMQVPQTSTAIHQRTYTKEEIDNLFTDIDDFEI